MLPRSLQALGRKFSGKPLVSFGVISDIQYADKPTVLGRNRYEKDAINKLRTSLQTWTKYHNNTTPLKCVVNLGDIIDAHEGENAHEKDKQGLKDVLSAFDTLSIPQYHVLGNHCVWNLGCEYLAKELRMPHRFYDVQVAKGWRLVFLDGTDMSLMKNSHSLTEAKEYVTLHGHRKLEEWNGGFSKAQLQWLKSVFAKAKKDKEKLILFCHWPVINSWAQKEFESSLLWNADEVLKLLDPEVVYMFMSGHIHENGYTLSNGIHHLTLAGVVATPGDHAHATVHIHEGGVEIEGFGGVTPLSASFTL